MPSVKYNIVMHSLIKKEPMTLWNSDKSLLTMKGWRTYASTIYNIF